MNTAIILAALAGCLLLGNVAQAETGIWHRFKEYDIGSPRPAVTVSATVSATTLSR